MILDEKILVSLDCDVYKYNLRSNSFEIRNYFKTDISKLLKEFDKIVLTLARNRIKFKVLKDNTISLLFPK